MSFFAGFLSGVLTAMVALLAWGYRHTRQQQRQHDEIFKSVMKAVADEATRPAQQAPAAVQAVSNGNARLTASGRLES